MRTEFGYKYKKCLDESETPNFLAMMFETSAQLKVSYTMKIPIMVSNKALSVSLSRQIWFHLIIISICFHITIFSSMPASIMSLAAGRLMWNISTGSVSFNDTCLTATGKSGTIIQMKTVFALKRVMKAAEWRV